MPGLPINLVIWHLHSHHEGHSTLNAFSFSFCWKNIWSSSQFKKWYWRQNCWRSRSWWRRISMASFLEKICWIWWKSFVSLSVYYLLDNPPNIGYYISTKIHFIAVVVPLWMKIGYSVLGIVVQDLEMMEKLWLELMIGRYFSSMYFSSTYFLKDMFLTS